MYTVLKNLQFCFHLTKEFPLELCTDIEANSFGSFSINMHTEIIPQRHDFITNKKKTCCIVSVSSLQNEHLSEVITLIFLDNS